MQTPKFMMGGVRVTKNFLGSSTMKAGTFSLGELVVKQVPFVMFFYALAQSGNMSGAQSAPQILLEDNLGEAAPVRRSSLTE